MYNDVAYNALDPLYNRMLNNELSTIALQLKDLLEKNYFGRILDLIEDEKKNVLENPPREMQLLNSLKPFFTRETQQLIEKAMDIMTAIYVIKQLQEQPQNQIPNQTPRPTPYDNRNINRQQCIYCNSLNNPGNPSVSDSVHHDGVYDYDPVCLVEKQNKEQKKVKLLTDLFYDVINHDYVKNTL